MKEILKEFLELLGYCVLGVCFLFASYLLLINLYHYREISVSQQRILLSEESYSDFTETIEKIKKNINSVDLNGSTNSQFVSAASGIKSGFDSCIKDLEASYFYQLGQKNMIVTQDIYQANKEMYNTINNKCLFFIPYYIETSAEGYGYGDSFEYMKDDVEFKKERIFVYSDFLFNKTLGNSSYSYTTSVSRSTIYNDLNQTINMTISNYNELVNTVLDISEWYVDEFGGAN